MAGAACLAFGRAGHLAECPTSIDTWAIRRQVARKRSCRSIHAEALVVSKSGWKTVSRSIRQLRRRHRGSQPSEKRKAAQTSLIRLSFSPATRLPKRSEETVTGLCGFTAHGPFMPSFSSSPTSEGTPRIVDVTGATVTVERCGIALSRVNTSTGLFLSGGAN